MTPTLQALPALKIFNKSRDRGKKLYLKKSSLSRPPLQDPISMEKSWMW
jgi:hypothetical protein